MRTWRLAMRERRRVVGRRRVGEQALRHVGRHDARAAEDDDGRLDALLVLDHLGLEQLELHAHRAQLFAQQEVGVGEGEPVGAVGAVVQGLRGDGPLPASSCAVGKLRTGSAAGFSMRQA